MEMGRVTGGDGKERGRSRDGKGQVEVRRD